LFILHLMISIVLVNLLKNQLILLLCRKYFFTNSCSTFIRSSNQTWSCSRTLLFHCRKNRIPRQCVL
jgi:hypothetical protein